MYHIIIQHAVDKTLGPRASLLRKWAKAALSRKIDAAEITLRIAGIDEMTNLNTTYRHKPGPTNVLSFPFNLPDSVEIDIPLLGDIVICSDVVNREADEQGKTKEAHWAHMVVHGVLHLLGYDHQADDEANVMENLERDVLNELGFADPYQTGEQIKDYD